MIARVSTGLAFIENKYLFQQRNAMGPDLAWLRNIYILLSFYFEILLKSALILVLPFADVTEIDIKLRRLGHRINVIGRELGDDNLKEIGIEDISLVNGEYIVTTFNKTIYIKDFNDVRYDFIEGRVRNISRNEDSIIQESVDGSYEILEKIKLKYSL